MYVRPAPLSYKVKPPENTSRKLTVKPGVSERRLTDPPALNALAVSVVVCPDCPDKSTGREDKPTSPLLETMMMRGAEMLLFASVPTERDAIVPSDSSEYVLPALFVIKEPSAITALLKDVAPFCGLRTKTDCAACAVKFVLAVPRSTGLVLLPTLPSVEFSATETAVTALSGSELAPPAAIMSPCDCRL